MTEIQTAEEFFSDPMPKFKVGEKVHLGFGARGGSGYIGDLQVIDTESNEAVIVVTEEPPNPAYGYKIVRGKASYLSKLH